MEKEITLFQTDELTFKYKFYTLIDILIKNQSYSRFESFLLLGIFYLQIISSFFSEQLNIFDPVNSKSDKILNVIEKIIRIKGLFKNNYKYFQILELCLLIIYILLIVHFLISCLNITRTSFYSYNISFINYYLKIFLYIGYNIILSVCYSNLCFGSDEYNANFPSIKCSTKNKILKDIIIVICIILTLFLYIYINIYYNDSFYLSNSYYAKMSCNYELYWAINCLALAILETQTKYITKELFLIYNFFISILLFIYYINHYLYYDKYINCFTGSFHMLYVWTSIFCLIFTYVNFTEKGIVYILTSVLVCFFYTNIKNRIESKIFLETPFFKINNNYYLLYYFHNLINKINSAEENPKDKSFLSGIIQMHEIECPLPNCILKTKEDLYLPLSKKWNDRRKNDIDDDVFLKHFIIIVMNYFLNKEKCSVDMYLNLSFYYLKVIGNYCQAIYYYNKVTELKLTLKEYYSFIRLNFQISKTLSEKLRPSNEICTDLENLDLSIYYKYDNLSHNFLKEINNDISLSLEFWKCFRDYQKEQNKVININRIFKLTDKIRITKNNIENMWNELLKIYGGVNDLFTIYLDYIEQINDDDLKKRDLEAFKRKNDNYGDQFNNNYYNILFNKETGIIIANGDKGNEGQIKLANNQIENIFKYKPIELKGMNVTNIMPKIFAENHSKYIENYFRIGQKKLLDKSGIKILAKDKKNCIIKVALAVKLFPILNENVFFASLIIKDNIDDIIFLDNEFNIQGMSSKLMKILNINNNALFQENEIPFYVICKKFVNFYNIFLINKQKKNNLTQERKISFNEGENNSLQLNKKINKEDNFENIEISENVELEYEIKLPKFLIDYSEKTNKDINIEEQLNAISLEKNDLNDSDDSDENLLFNQEKNRMVERHSQTNTPGEETFYGVDMTPKAENTIINEVDKDFDYNKQSEEEKIYNNLINQYINLFNQGKISELEKLIEDCNNESLSIEYKFNFTFNKFIYNKNKIAYIVRCIDHKNDYGNSEDEAINVSDINVLYKREKIESIKILYEILDDEKNEIIEMPKIFQQLSTEDKKFQKLLLTCKNDIIKMSQIHGQKNDIIIENENTSQTHQTGFDTKLIKKNRIEEIRSNIFMNVSSFYTLKYIKLSLICFGISIFFLSFLYYYYFSMIYYDLDNTVLLNIFLYQSTEKITQLISIFISLRTLYQKYIINYDINDSTTDFYFYDYFSNSNDNNSINNNSLYYNNCISMIVDLYNKTYKSYEFLENKIPRYLNNAQLKTLFWNRVNISYMDESYYNYSQSKDNETFSMAINQILSNSIYFNDNEVFNSIENDTISKFFEEKDLYEIYFNYTTFIIIENGYDNILPNQINKILTIPNILSKYNSKKKQILVVSAVIYFFFVVIIYISYYFLIFITNNSMNDGILKVTKIQLEKIEEIIKRIKLFNINLKRFKEKDLKNTEDKIQNNPQLAENETNLILKRFQTRFSEKENQIKKKEQKSQILNATGFNIDTKKYISLNILKYTFYPPIIILLCIFIVIICIFIKTIQVIDNTNMLLVLHKYIFGLLIKCNINIIEIKMFISDCQNKTSGPNFDIINIDLIQEALKGLGIYYGINNYYSSKFMFNACDAAIDPEKDPEKYNICLSDDIILNANNTDNLIKLIDEFVHNIKKEHEMIMKMPNYDPNKYDKKQLYNSTDFKNIEHIYFNYIYGVSDIFENVTKNDFYSYLEAINHYISISIISIGIVSIIYCIIYWKILSKKLIHYLSISRCVMKIIPTSVIISTQELEDWIESKFE